MKIFFVTALFLAVAASQVYSQACHMREVDLCMAIGMFHYQSNGLPGDEEKVNEWCETMTEVGECMGNYSSKCLSPFQREVVWLMTGSENPIKEFCDKGSEQRARYLQHAECLAEESESDEFKAVLKDFQVCIERVFESPIKDRIPVGCCGYRRFYQDTNAVTARRCGEAAVETFIGIMKMVTTGLPDTMCQPYDPESEQCKNLLPPRGTPPKGGENRSQISKIADTIFGSN